MRRLVLLRHATAQDGHGKPDFDRELTPGGRDEAVRMGRWLGRRALQTALLACAVIGIDRDQVVTDPALYDCTPTTLLRRIARFPGRLVLVVGHNPSLEQVALHLTGDDDLAMVGLPPAGAVAIELPDDWDDLEAKASKGWVRGDPTLTL